MSILFYEPSARAKLSYEMAAQHLSANVVDMTMATSAYQEKLQDMGQLVDQTGADFIIFSLKPSPALITEALTFFANNLAAPAIG